MYIVSVLFSKQFCVWCLDHKSYNKCGCYGFSLCSPESYPNLLQLYLYYLLNCTLHCSGGSRGGAWGPGSPLIFRPNWGPKGGKKFFWRPAPHFSKGLDDPTHTPPPPIISRFGASTALPMLIMSFICNLPPVTSSNVPWERIFV